MKVLDIQEVGVRELRDLLTLLGRGYAYCTRGCGKWGSPSCYSCMFRDVRKLHKRIKDNDATRKISG